MTESPTAVTWLPDTRSCPRWHAAGGVGVALAGACPVAGGADEGEGVERAEGVAWEALITRSPLATCRSNPLGASGAGGLATP